VFIKKYKKYAKAKDMISINPVSNSKYPISITIEDRIEKTKNSIIIFLSSLRIFDKFCKNSTKITEF